MQDGWCRSGDRGYYNTSEQIFVIGRYKELIKYRMAHVTRMMRVITSSMTLALLC